MYVYTDIAKLEMHCVDHVISGQPSPSSLEFIANIIRSANHQEKKRMERNEFTEQQKIQIFDVSSSLLDATAHEPN